MGLLIVKEIKEKDKLVAFQLLANLKHDCALITFLDRVLRKVMKYSKSLKALKRDSLASCNDPLRFKCIQIGLLASFPQANASVIPLYLRTSTLVHFIKSIHN